MTLIPYDALPAEAWTRLREAADSPTHPMRVLVLATIDSSGSPAARLMVLRGANRTLGRVWFYTDRRSEKVEQVERCPAISAVAWDPDAAVQLRITGTATVHADDQLVAKHWSQVEARLRALYAAPEAPGMPLRELDPHLMSTKRAMDFGTEEIARGNFAVVETQVQTIEWLQLSGDDRRRAIMHESTGWAAQPLAP